MTAKEADFGNTEPLEPIDDLRLRGGSVASGE
jgi:hypothetical protein